MNSHIKTFSATHIGYVREKNEDRSLIAHFDPQTVLLCIADGMGGHAAGEVAAQIAIDTFDAADRTVISMDGNLRALLHQVHERIAEAALKDANLYGMATTLTALLIKEGTAFWVHIGDTRLYLFRSGRLTQVTEDHTIPGTLLRRGEITKEEARAHPFRNMLLRCLGCDSYEAESGSFALEPSDLLLLTSDGLHDLVGEDAIASVLGQKAGLQLKLSSLIISALDAGGSDNITAVAAEYR